MKKLLFVLSGFVLLSVFVLPAVLARKPPVANKAPHRTTAKNTPPAPIQQPQAQPPQPTTGQRAEAFTTAPGVPFEPKQLKEPRAASLRAETDAEEEAETAPESDIDPATLRRLKQQPWRAPLATQPYTVQQDGATKQTRTSDGQQPLAPTQVRSFTGVSSNDQLDGFYHRPPDPDMAAGPNHIVTVVNSLFTVYNKSGAMLLSNSLKTRYNVVCSTCSPFDPRIAYDPVSNHWLMMALHHNESAHESNVLVSVSQTSDPTGVWFSYKLDGILAFNGEDTWADYPDLSFDGSAPEQGGAVYITTNQFTFGAGFFRTATLSILPKSALYAGTALNYWRDQNHLNADGSQAFTLRAAKTYGNPGVEYLINSRNGGSYVSLWRVAPTYPPTPVDWTLQQSITITTGGQRYTPPPDAAQAGGCGLLLATGDNRMYNAVWRNDHLYAAFAEAHDWGGGGGTVSAVHYLKINTTTNAAEINQLYGADGAYYFYPSIATDSADNIVLVFVRSSATEFGSIRYTGRLTTDATIQDSASLKDGVQCLTGNRYGDYQGAAIDPADGTKVWLYGEWTARTAGTPVDFDWGTWIGQVSFGTGPTCSYSLTPTARNFTASGGSDMVGVTTSAGCAWTASNNGNTWITITSGASGTDSGPVNYTVAANPNTSPRTGTMTIAGQTFTVTQDAAPCVYTLAPTAQSFTAAPATSSVGVTANSGCGWTAVSNSNFITINSGSSGNGSGTVSYSVTQNTTTSQRTGTMTIAGQTFTVTQAAVANSTCIPTALSFGQIVNSTLATSDCRATFHNGSYADRYTFNGIAGQQISISLSSVAYDTLLYLLAPAGTIATFDDDGGGGTNSRIPATSGTFALPTTGTYVIEATTFNPDTTGAYTLTLDGTTPAATVQFSAPGYSFSEGATSAPIVVTRTGDTTGTATVVFATADNTAAVPCSTINGTAYARCDYATTVDTLTFAPNVTSKTINIPLINDAYVEGNETAQLTLTNPAGATLGAQQTATLTITDNDAGSAANPIFSAPFFVRLQYLDFLSREPDTPGFNAWLNVLNGCPDVNNIDPNSASAGCDRILVSSSFFGSQEFQLKGFFVFRFYKVAFNRLPQYTEIVADMRSVTGSTAQEVFTKKAVFSNTFTQRPEFTNLYGPLSDANYVAALMGRYGLNSITTPDPAAPDGTNKVTLTTANLTSQLSAGTLTRAQVLRAIADSDQVNTLEFTNAFVGMQYYGYLRRTPDTPGFNAWFNYLTANPTDFRTMVNGFMNSQEYRLRFGAP
ncbi:MAG: Calx-beta domain-containing protein [Pyrinomonadaceae bacterium]